MILNEEELKILKICCEEPGDMGSIISRLKMTKSKVEQILKKLKKLKFIYKDFVVKDSDDWWFSTLEGDKYLYKK